jgi:hypothetical protein
LVLVELAELVLIKQELVADLTVVRAVAQYLLQLLLQEAVAEVHVLKLVVLVVLVVVVETAKALVVLEIPLQLLLLKALTVLLQEL